MARRVGIVVLLVMVVLAWAWWDGGRESLSPIEQPVPVPANSLPEDVR